MFERCCLLAALFLVVGCKGEPAQTVASAPAPTRSPSPAAEPLADLEERAFPLLIWSAYHVEQEYFDKSRFDPREQLLAATRMMGLQTPEFFAELEPGEDVLRVSVSSRIATFALSGLDSMLAAADRLEQVLIFTDEVLELDSQLRHELEYGAINGLFAPLDPHTILLSPDEHTDLGVRTRGHFGGIGAQIRAENRRISIVRVLPGMPAEKAGMLAGDVVLTIDGAATVNMLADEAQSMLRGPVGDVVMVVVRRGTKVHRLEITRDTIRIDSVTSAMLPDAIAYLNISTFQENTGEMVEQVLRTIGGESGPAGVIVDLRGNSGGLLTQATAVVDAFVRHGELVIVRSATGREVKDATDAVALADRTPVVVLIDEDSASAAEIVSGGLKALGRGVVLGRSSFGKGTVQMIKPASPYGRELALKMTVAEYLVAGDRSIQSLGVMPDLELIPMEQSTIPGIARYYDEERFERQRERSRTAHLPSAKYQPTKPREPAQGLRLRYRWTAQVPDELREATSEESSRDILRDPEIRLAREVARGMAEGGEPTGRIARLQQIAAQLQAQEDRRITAALADAKVNWAAGPSSDTPELSVRARLVKPGPVTAGKPFNVKVEVENRGASAVSRVHSITDCVHDELDGIELLIGRIEPGQTVARELKLQVMPWHSNFSDTLTFDVHAGEPDPSADAQTVLRFEVAGVLQPNLAYDWWIVDSSALVPHAPDRPKTPPIPGVEPFVVKGNGDGMLAPGERVLLAFEARNTGLGASPDVRAVLHNASAPQGLLEEGAVTLGALKPGERARASFGISVNDDADPGQPFEVELVVGDTQMRTRAGDTLRLRVLAQAPEFEPERGRMRVEGDTQRIYNGGHASAEVLTELPVRSEVPFVGQVGPWRVFDAPRGRRVFGPADLGHVVTEPRTPRSKTHKSTVAFEWEPLVLPPTLHLDAVPLVVTTPQMTLRGTATHPRRVRDVAVLVRPPGASQIDRKVHYAANPARSGPLAQSMTFEAEVPLELGGNRVTILVRDGRKVERRTDVWIFRDPP